MNSIHVDPFSLSDPSILGICPTLAYSDCNLFYTIAFDLVVIRLEMNSRISCISENNQNLYCAVESEHPPIILTQTISSKKVYILHLILEKSWSM